MPASRRIDTAAARAAPGVVAVLTHHDAPDRLFSTGRHEDHRDDPDDTRVLDPVLRFVGQRVAAVVAESEAAAEAACGLIAVAYELLPAVFDPEAAMQPGAPVLHDKARSRASTRPIATSPPSCMAAAATSRPASPPPPPSTRPPTSRQRVPMPRSETQAAIGWLDDEGRLVLRTSTQVPYLTRDALCRLFDLPKAQVRVRRPASAAASAASRRC